MERIKPNASSARLSSDIFRRALICSGWRPPSTNMMMTLLALLLRRDFDSELAELPLIDVARRLGHKIDHAIGFREGDHFADAFFAGDQHDDAVKAESDPAVWRSPEAKGAEKVAEKRLLISVVNAEG